MLNPFGKVPRAVKPGVENHRSQVRIVSDDLATEVDCHGSPVSIPAAEWLVCFVPGLQKQWWHRFANSRHQHVFAIRMLADGSWLLVESWWTRMLVSVLTLDEALKFLRWGAAGDILQVREAVPGRGNQLRGWSNCAVMMAFMLGRAYRTWTPHGLYRRLFAEQGVRAIDLWQWFPGHVRVAAARDVDQALESLELDKGQTLKPVLRTLGTAVLRGLMSPSALALHRASISESCRFAAAANAYWNCGLLQRAVEVVHGALQQARIRGEIDIDEPGLAARQFVAMLRGDIHLEILFGLRSGPDVGEIRTRVQSAVDLFLDGAILAAPSTQAVDDPRFEECLNEAEGT